MLGRFLVAFVLVVAGFAAAFDLHSGAQYMEITPCTGGSTQVWVADAPIGSKVYFNAPTHEFGVAFDDASLYADSSGAKGTRLTLNAPECFEGSRQLQVTAQVCAGEALLTCQSKTISIHVRVLPCPTQNCGSETLALQPRESYVPAQSCGEAGCSQVLSRVEFADYFAPTRKSLDIERYSPTYCIEGGRRCDFDQLESSRSFVASYRIANTGAAGTFVITPSSDSQLRVSPARMLLDLQRGEERIISFIVRASESATPGLAEVRIKALSESLVVAEEKSFVEILGGAGEEAVLTLPTVTGRGIVLEACRLPTSISIPARFENRGAFADDFRVQATIDGLTGYSRTFRLDSGLVAEFNIDIDSRSLRSGDNVIEITAYSNRLVGRGSVPVRVNPCSAASVGSVSIKSVSHGSVSDLEMQVVATLVNTGSPLSNVVAEITGLPQGWQATSESTSLASGSERNLTTTLRMPIDGIANSSDMIIKSNGVEVARVRLGNIERRGGSLFGFTGLAIDATTSDFLLGLFILLAAALLFYHFGHRHEPTRRTQPA